MTVTRVGGLSPAPGLSLDATCSSPWRFSRLLQVPGDRRRPGSGNVLWVGQTTLLRRLRAGRRRREYWAAPMTPEVAWRTRSWARSRVGRVPGLVRYPDGFAGRGARMAWWWARKRRGPAGCMTGTPFAMTGTPVGTTGSCSGPPAGWSVPRRVGGHWRWRSAPAATCRSTRRTRH